MGTPIASSRPSPSCSCRPLDDRGAVLLIDDLHAADEATVALVHHLARSAAASACCGRGMRDEPLPKAAALVRSSLVERGAPSRWRSVALDRGGARGGRAAGRDPSAPARAPRRHRALGGRQPVLRRGPCGVGGCLRRDHSRRRGCARSWRGRLERLDQFGERLLAALAVIDDGFTAGSSTALAGTTQVEETLGEQRSGRRARDRAGRYRFRHAFVREELAARLPEETLRDAHAEAAGLLPRATRRPRRRRTTCSRRPRSGGCSAPHPGCPVGRRRGRLPATAPSGRSWRSSMRTSTSARRSSRCARHCSTGPASPTPPPPTPRRSRSHPRTRARAAGATGARLSRGRRRRARRPRWKGWRPRGRRTSVS